jgi:hypothetical protein
MRPHGSGSTLHNRQPVSTQGSSYLTSCKEKLNVPARSSVRSHSKDSLSSLGSSPQAGGSLSSFGSIGSLGTQASHEAAPLRARPYRSGSGSIPAYRSENSTGEESNAHGWIPTPPAAAGAATAIDSSSMSSSGKLGGYGVGAGVYTPSTVPSDMRGSNGDMSR